jgi:hypothetical protein
VTGETNMMEGVMSNQIEEYKKLLHKMLQANQLPKHDLETRYRKAYLRLKEEVKEETINIIKYLCFYGFNLLSNQKGINNRINKLLETQEVKKILNNVSCICRYPDYEKVEKTAFELREYILKNL